MCDHVTQVGKTLEITIDAAKLKREYNHHKDWNKQERVEKRVGSWRDFGKRNKRQKSTSSWAQEHRGAQK